MTSIIPHLASGYVARSKERKTQSHERQSLCIKGAPKTDFSFWSTVCVFAFRSRRRRATMRSSATRAAQRGTRRVRASRTQTSWLLSAPSRFSWSVQWAWRKGDSANGQGQEEFTGTVDSFCQLNITRAKAVSWKVSVAVIREFRHSLRCRPFDFSACCNYVSLTTSTWWLKQNVSVWNVVSRQV